MQNWNATRSYLKSINVDIQIISNYHNDYSGSIITMPEGEQIGCSFGELSYTGGEAEAYAVSKAFKLINEL